jgi:hypothetical protein
MTAEAVPKSGTCQRGNHPKLGKMNSDRINLLTDEPMARAAEQKAALLLESPGRHEPYISPSDCLANGSASVASFVCRLT